MQVKKFWICKIYEDRTVPCIMLVLEYIKKLVERIGMRSVKHVSIPFAAQLKFSTELPAQTEDKKEDNSLQSGS